MKLIPLNTFFKGFILMFVLFSIASCNNGSGKYERAILVGQWRESSHGNREVDLNHAITLILNNDKSCSITVPNVTSFKGSWSTANIDTIEVLAIKNSLQISSDTAYYSYRKSTYKDDYYPYYFFRINRAEKGKLYLVDMSSRYSSDLYVEHLLKPQE